MLSVTSAKDPDLEFVPADPAAKNVDIANIARYGPKGRSAFMCDPATGTLIVRPEADIVIRKALRRAARRIALRLLLRKPLLDFERLLLEVRYASLRFRCYLA